MPVKLGAFSLTLCIAMAKLQTNRFSPGTIHFIDFGNMKPVKLVFCAIFLAGSSFIPSLVVAPWEKAATSYLDTLHCKKIVATYGTKEFC